MKEIEAEKKNKDKNNKSTDLWNINHRNSWIFIIMTNGDITIKGLFN
jgi:hypothetical protein